MNQWGSNQQDYSRLRARSDWGPLTRREDHNRGDDMTLEQRLTTI